MKTGVICHVTFCRLVYDVSKDPAAFIYEVKQSEREILDSLTMKVREIRILLKSVNIYDVSKDPAAFIYKVKQSKREILDSLTMKVKELCFFLKPVNIYLSIRRNISKGQIFPERFWDCS